MLIPLTIERCSSRSNIIGYHVLLPPAQSLPPAIAGFARLFVLLTWGSACAPPQALCFRPLSRAEDLPPTSRALQDFLCWLSWGFAALHPRLYAFARCRGLRICRPPRGLANIFRTGGPRPSNSAGGARLYALARYRGLAAYQRPVLRHNCSQVSRCRRLADLHHSSECRRYFRHNIF